MAQTRSPPIWVHHSSRVLDSGQTKLFVSYLDNFTLRRLAICWEIDEAELGSLEEDLQETEDDALRAELVRESIEKDLDTVEFVDMITKLRIKTIDGRLHLFISEDTEETGSYPEYNKVTQIFDKAGIQISEVHESELIVDSLVSGLTYKVRHENKESLYKAIFYQSAQRVLYEILVLATLEASAGIVRVRAIVLDESGEFVRGFLMNNTGTGTVDELLSQYPVPWEDRIRWAWQITCSLHQVHQAGFIHGDLVLENILLDENQNSMLAGFDRLGLGGHLVAPEMENLPGIDLTGQKSDLYQLGLVLRALASQGPGSEDGQRQNTGILPVNVPSWYRTMVTICLSPRPGDRWSAEQLRNYFAYSVDTHTDHLA